MGLVSGVVFSNVSTEMVVFGEEETLADDGQGRTDSRKEFVVWGLAMESDSVRAQTFPTTLGTTLGVWLEGQKLIEK